MEHWEKIQQQRKIEADIIADRRRRFEEIMEMSDIGLIDRLTALDYLNEDETDNG